MRSVHRAALCAVATLALLLTGCAAERVAGPPPGDLPEPLRTITHGERHGTDVTQPGAFLVRYDETELQLQPFTYCYSTGMSGGCVDGFDDRPPSVGSPDELLVFVPVQAFTSLVVSQTGAGDDPECTGRVLESDVTDVGYGWWLVRPTGPADDYRIELFASGDGSGDMIANLMWTTPLDAALPDAEASLVLIADHDGEPDSYGVELSVSNLTSSPDESAATITVTASNGESSTFDATPADGCRPEASLYFDGPMAEAEAAAALGDFPFEYRVELTLDGVTYVGSGIYPDDLDDPTGLAVPLDFVPALP